MTKVILNSFFGDIIQKHLVYKQEFKTERWMATEYVDRIEENLKLQSGDYIVKTKNDQGLNR